MIEVAAVRGVCAKHPEIGSSVVCRRCGGFLCGTCDVGEGCCADCFVRDVEQSASPLARLALGLALLGLCTLLPGLVGLLLGQRELRAIAAGRSPRSGRPLALGAVILGWFCVAALGLILAGAVSSVSLDSVEWSHAAVSEP